MRTTADLFWPRVVKSETCWLTTGTHSHGYGMIHVPKTGGGWKPKGMHVVAWFLATGHWPTKDEAVCHNCPGGDNPACVRNDEIGVYVLDGVEYPRRGHLWLGTVAANNLDTARKGHNAWQTHPERMSRGETHSSAKRTDAEILDIRRRHAAGDVTYQALANEYRMDPSSIRAIVKREHWKHLP
jgi:hypothetical protein